MIQAFLVESFLELSAARFPEKTALICGKRRVSYAEVERQSNRQAHQLLRAGVKRGNRVAIYLDNSPEAVFALFGTLKAGAVFVPIHPATKPAKLAAVLDDCQARAVITDERKLARIPEAQCLLARLTAIDPAADDSRPAKQSIDMDLAALVYTSGSTGTPKGVMLTHRNVMSTAASVALYLKNTKDDVVLNVLPLSFGYGLYQVLVTFKVGGTLVLERSFAYPYALIETMIRECVTGLPLVPTVAAILLQLDLSKSPLPSLRYISSAAAALPVDHIRKLRALLPHVQIYSMYGLTECQRASYLPPEQIDHRPLSVGKGMPNEEVFVVDDHGAEVPAGVVGELVVRGSNVMKGYWNLPSETAQALRRGPVAGETMLHTGDLFRTDEEGYLYFMGRKDDIIKSRGEKVSPREVENVLCNMPDVSEAVVMGVPDAILGSAVQAFIVPRHNAVLIERDVLRHCADHLEDFMIPKYVTVVAALPRLANGKIDKLKLAAKL